MPSPKNVTTAATVALCSALVAAGAANAEGFEIGGYVVLERYDSNDLESDTTFFEHEVNLVGTLGYRTGEWYFGVGQQYQSFYYDDGGSFAEMYDHFVMIGYGPLLVTYGEIQGAGNLFNEDFFGMSDATSRSDNTIRIDYAPGGDSNILRHVALSYDTDDEDFMDGLELGLSLDFNGTLVALGYEGDNNYLGLMVAHQFGETTLHGIYHDQDGEDIDLAVTAFRTFGPVEIGLHVEVEPEEGALEALGAVVYYDTPIGLFNAQLRREYDYEEVILETGILIPFGTTAPYYAERSTEREQLRRFGF